MTNVNEHWHKVQRFIRTWKALARYGWCDQWGSAEQRRVFEQWKAAGSPLPTRPFIVKHANATPEVPNG